MLKKDKQKQAWIEETQMFQRIARNGQEADSYESLSKDYDEHLLQRHSRKKKAQ